MKRLLIAIESRYPVLPGPGVIDCDALALQLDTTPAMIRRALRTIREQRAMAELRRVA